MLPEAITRDETLNLLTQESISTISRVRVAFEYKYKKAGGRAEGRGKFLTFALESDD